MTYPHLERPHIMLEDLRPELFHNSGLPYFNSCISCGLSSVLKPGDYCRKCAGTWDLPEYRDEYLVVTEDTIDEAVYQTDLPRSYYEEQLKRLTPKQRLVAFYAQDAWQDIVVHEMLHLPTVMNNLFQALGHK